MRPSRLSHRAWLRIVYAGFAVLVGNVSWYVWVTDSDATDWEWFYRLALPAAMCVFIVSVVNPKAAGMTKVFLPLSLIAVVRMIDFMQDWFLTPLVPESPSLQTRVLLASFGWSAIALFNVLVWRCEEMLEDLSHRTCLEAPACARNRPLPQNILLDHPARSPSHDPDNTVR